MKKYVDIPRKDLENKIENSWFEKCRKQKLPFITVKCRTKFADVHWDYIAYPEEVDGVLRNLSSSFRDGVIAIL